MEGLGNGWIGIVWVKDGFSRSKLNRNRNKKKARGDFVQS